MGQSIKFSTAIWRLVLALVFVLLQPLGVVGNSEIAQAASPATAERSFALPSGENAGLHHVHRPNLQESNQRQAPARGATMPSAEVQAANPAWVEPLPAPLPNDRFGLVYVNWPEYQESFHNLGKPESIINETTEQRYTMALGTGARWNRWPVVWSKIEPEGAHDDPQNWNWEWVDKAAISDIEHGLQINAILKNTPAFHGALQSSPPGSLHEDPFDENGQVNPANAWAWFVYQTVERYKPGGTLDMQQRASNPDWPVGGAGIRHWEIWNEADRSNEWTGTERDYAELLSVAYRVIKKADPNATVLFGGIAWWGNETWLEYVRNELRVMEGASENNYYFDVLATHWYQTPRDSYEKNYQPCWKLIRDMGSKEIWVNESGIALGNADLFAYDEEQQADYVIQNYAFGHVQNETESPPYTGATKLFHFRLYDDCPDYPGMVRPFGLAYSGCEDPTVLDEPRWSYLAAQMISQYLRGAEFQWPDNAADLEESEKKGYQELAFYREDTEEFIRVLWATKRENVENARIVAVPRQSTPTATLVTWQIDEQSGEVRLEERGVTAQEEGGKYYFTGITLEGSTYPHDVAKGARIGGKPVFLIEKNVSRPPSYSELYADKQPPELKTTRIPMSQLPPLLCGLLKAVGFYDPNAILAIVWAKDPGSGIEKVWIEDKTGKKYFKTCPEATATPTP